MRIIAGEMRSRTILTPKGTDTRPTLDRARESLFNIIAAWCPDARVLDLYAGSGALALEAISRGAQSAVLCDSSREAARVIKANIEALRVQDRARPRTRPCPPPVCRRGRRKLRQAPSLK